MNTNPYNIDDLEVILLRVPNSNIPELLQTILLAREYERLLTGDKERLIENIEYINNLDPNYSLSAKNKIIMALKEKIKNYGVRNSLTTALSLIHI